MKKVIATLLFVVLCCSATYATESATDVIDGHYWQAMTSDTQKRNFLTGYLLGKIHEIDLIDIFTGYVVRKYNSELADDLLDFLNNNIKSFRKLTLDEYVKFLNDGYKDDKRNLNIPIVSMINFAIDSENMTRKEIKARLQQLRKIFADKDKKNSK